MRVTRRANRSQQRCNAFIDIASKQLLRLKGQHGDFAVRHLLAAHKRSSLRNPESIVLRGRQFNDAAIDSLFGKAVVKV